jgi:hypothetical protein
MNEPEDSLPDEVIDELLAPLRDVSCPEEVHRANRRAIESALAQRLGTPWWRRSVAVPLPLAIAASVLLMLTTGALLWPMANGPNVIDTRLTPRTVTAANRERPAWSLSRSYILSIDSISEMENSFRPDSKEERNDS